MRTLASLLLVTAALTGCAPSDPGFLVPADTVATGAEDVLEEQVGTRPDIDCGSTDITVKEDKTIDCVLTDPTTGDRLKAVITFVDVLGTDYQISMDVDDEPLK